MNANPSSADFYERLGIAPDVTPEQIAAAFKAMRKELHPDSRPESLRRHFDKLMQNVNEAYQTLSDPPARAKYDAKRRAGAQGQQQEDRRGAEQQQQRQEQERRQRTDNFGWGEEGSVAARFTVSRTDAASAFLNWLAAYKYTPLDVLEPSILDSTRRVYVPYYRFYVEYRADFRASVGYHQWEQYTESYTTYDARGRARQAYRPATRLRIDWHPYKDAVSNRFTVAFADRIPQGSDFAAFLNETTFKDGELVPPTPVADEIEILPFARTPEASYTEFVKDAIDRRVLAQIERTLPGDTYKQLSRNWNSNYDWRRVYLPFWHFSWKYEGEVHGALVDGRQHTRVTGWLPKDEKLQQSANYTLRPLWLALGLAFVLALLAGFVEVPSEFQTGLFVIIGLAVVAVGFGSYQRRHQVLGDAEARRKAAVEQILSSLSES